MLQYAADAAVESLNFPSLLCLGEEPLEIMAFHIPYMIHGSGMFPYLYPKHPPFM